MLIMADKEVTEYYDEEEILESTDFDEDVEIYDEIFSELEEERCGRKRDS